MLKSLREHIMLWLQARTGLTGTFFVSVAISAVAAVTVFAFLCVSAYAWSSTKIGPVFGALAMAGVFLLIAVGGAVTSVLSRRQTKNRAVLAQAARAQQTIVPANPAMLKLGMQAARALGWERVVPVALVGFLLARWAQGALVSRRVD
jgi:hypothetical protein